MKFIPAGIDGVVIVEPEPQEDERGFLVRTYCEREFAEAGLNTRWVQQNQTLTRGMGSVRGMHWQAQPYSEIKLVRCLAGRVLDVVVDVRPGSLTFGRWISCELSQENRRALYLPAGFAHGFQCLGESCELLYLMSEFYRPEQARGFRCDDAEIGIDWPLSVVSLSARDGALPSLRESEF